MRLPSVRREQWYCQALRSTSHCEWHRGTLAPSVVSLAKRSFSRPYLISGDLGPHLVAPSWFATRQGVARSVVGICAARGSNINDLRYRLSLAPVRRAAARGYVACDNVPGRSRTRTTQELCPA